MGQLFGTKFFIKMLLRKDSIFSQNFPKIICIGLSNELLCAVKKSGLVLLESFALSMQHDQKGRSWMDVDILGQALFERLLLSRDDLTKAVLSETNNADAAGHSVETRVIIYLSESYLRCHNQQQAIKNRVSLHTNL